MLDSMAYRTVAKALGPLQRRLGLLVNWGKIHRVETTNNFIAAQVEMASGEISQEVIHAEPYGMTATPLPEAVGLVLCMSGERDSAVIAQASDPRYRPQGLPPGDVCLYTHQDDRTATAEEAQHRLQFTADRTVVLTAKRLKIICGSQTLVMDEDKIRLEGAMIELQA